MAHTYRGIWPVRVPIPHQIHRTRCCATLGKQPQELKLASDIPIALQCLSVDDRQLPLMVADCDAVMQMYIDAGQGDRDPYWTCPWPSSIALAQELLRRPELVAGLRVADLGCGLGLAGVAAALAGAAEVVFLDREPLALQCTLANAALSGVCEFPESLRELIAAVDSDSAIAQALIALEAHRNSDADTVPRDCTVQGVVFDWNNPAALEPFDVVLACDVLYEEFSVEPLARIAPALVASTGRLLLADPPNRAKHNRERFVQLVADSGLLPEECGERQAKVWEESKSGFVDVPVTVMLMKRGSYGDTVGVKIHAD